MTDQRQAMQMALEALDTSLFWLKSLNLGKTFDDIKQRADALRAALAAEPQPVATLHDDGSFTWKRDEFRLKYDRQRAGWRMDVYAAPTANEIDRLRDLNRQLVDKANGYVIHNARLNDENQRLRAELAAPTAQPLTDEQINQLVVRHIDHGRGCILRVARAIERAHGIGG